MRGGLYFLGGCAAAVIARTKKRSRNRDRITLPFNGSPGQWVFAPLPIYQLFHKLHALEIQELHVFFLASVQWHVDLPRTREDLGILNRRFVGDHIRTRTSITLDDV